MLNKVLTVVMKMSCSPSETKFIRAINNIINEDEEAHADPNKAKGIADLLKKEKVQVLVSKSLVLILTE